jgi:hypothetical protein
MDLASVHYERTKYSTLLISWHKRIIEIKILTYITPVQRSGCEFQGSTGVANSLTPRLGAQQLPSLVQATANNLANLAHLPAIHHPFNYRNHDL